MGIQNNDKLKVGIITIIHGTNYGNRLQNYAVQKTLEELGVVAETIFYNNPDIIPSFKQRILNKLRFYKRKKHTSFIQYRKYSQIKAEIFKIKNREKIISSRETRNNRFTNFNSKYIKYSKFIIEDNFVTPEINDYYDFFLCGSDQIWNPYYTTHSYLYFLMFSNYDKNIAYAPSLGVSDFPEGMRENYLKWISNIKYLSVREKAGLDIIKNITGREPIVLLDPTLMLNKTDWVEIAQQPKSKPKNNYILTYFLGGENSLAKKKIDYISKIHKMEVFNLQDYKDFERYTINPNEFIDLIKDASLVCTDSFHGTAFAVIMKVPFIVFERIGTQGSMNSRIDNLLSLLNLRDRFVSDIDLNYYPVFDINYSNIDLILEVERNKALNYLKKALAIKDET